MEKKVLSFLLFFIFLVSFIIYSPVNILADTLDDGEYFATVSLGEYHSAALTSEGKVLVWGQNNYGQLGYSQYSNVVIKPDEITSLLSLSSGETVISLTSGSYNTSVVTSTNRILVWGRNDNGQVGKGTTTNVYSPTDITGQFNLAVEETITQVSLGGYHSAVLTSNGRIFTWGDNSNGQLGDGTTTDKSVPTDITSQFTSLLNLEETITSISLGEYHSAVLTSAGRVFTWGGNNSGQLGNSTYVNSNTPIDITSQFSLALEESIIEVSLGDDHSGILTSNGNVYTWGSGASGQLGNNTIAFALNTPVNITSKFWYLSSGEIITSIAFKGDSSTATSSGGDIYAWGENNHYQLGIGTTDDKNIPQLISTQFSSLLASGETITNIFPGKFHSSAVSSSGTLFLWGLNSSGQVGDYTLVDKPTPVLISDFYLDAVIKFEENGGSAVTNISVTPGAAISEPSDPTRIGYTFEGWYEDDNTFLTEYTFVTMPNNSITLYAKWTTIDYNVIFDANAGTGSMSNQTIPYDSSEYLEPNTFTLTGYTFTGWNTETNGTGTTYLDEVNFTMDVEGITLYAQWAINQYNVEYVDFDGSVLQTEGFDYNADLSGVTAPADPTRVGYTFDSWSGTVPATMGSSDVTITATYTINQYTVEYVDYDGTVFQTEDFNYNSDLSGVTAPTDPTREGYTFNGWDITLPATMSANDVTITATYTINQYTVEYVDHNGTVLQTADYDYNADLSGVTEPTDPIRVGYTFNGWDASLPATMGSSDVTITATYTINQYTIEFLDYDGTVLQTGDYDYNADLSGYIAPLNPSRAGYTFTGWSGQLTLTMPASDLTITAIYTIDSFTVEYVDFDGTVLQTADYDYNADLSGVTAPADPTRVGYTFDSWSGTLPATMGSSDVTITATYTINQYTITFDSNGGSAVATITQDYDTAVTSPINPTKEGYTFNGWSQSVPSHMPSSNLTLIAHWLKVETNSEDLDTVVEGLLDSIDSELIEGKDVEVIIQIETKSESDVLPIDSSLIEELTATLDIDRQGILYLAIDVIIKELNEDDVFVNQLDQMITVTIQIPLEQQGFANYQIVRVHDGIAEVLLSTYDEENQTLTFETDRFSTYAIVYDATGGTWMWWLLLLLVIPVGYLGYVYRETIKTKISVLFAKDSNEE